MVAFRYVGGNTVLKLRYPLSVVAIVLAGCTTTSQSVSVAPPPEPEPAVVAPAPVAETSFVLASASAADTAEVRFTPKKDTDAGGNIYYAIGVVYIGTNAENMCFIKPGASLDLLIDGGPQFLSSARGSGGVQKALDDGRVAEAAVYTVSPDLLRKLANAKDVRVKIEGERRTVERYFGPANFEAYRQFLMQSGL